MFCLIVTLKCLAFELLQILHHKINFVKQFSQAECCIKNRDYQYDLYYYQNGVINQSLENNISKREISERKKDKNTITWVIAPEGIN